MSKHHSDDPVRDIYRGLVVQEHGRTDLLGYLKARSRADDGRRVTN